MSASKQLGIDFSVQHVKDLLQAFVDARRESAATARSLVKDAQSVAQGMRSLQSATAKASLQHAKVSANPSQNVRANASPTGLMINIKLAPIVVAVRGGSGTSVGGAGRSGGLSFPSGPRQRLIALQNMLPMAAAQGNHAALMDIQEQAMRLQRRMQPKSTGDKLWEAITTSRFGSGGAMPLVGKSLDVVGGRNSPLAKGLLGVAILGNAALEAGKAIIHLTQEANAFVMSQVRLQAYTGGSAAETARLRGVGIASGLSAEDVGGLAKNLQSAISTPGFGMMYGAKLGIMNMPGPLGNQDLAGQELKFVERFRKFYQSDKSPNHGESLRIARSLGQEALLPAMSLPQKDWHSAIQAGLDTQQSPQRMIQALRFQSSQEKVQAAWGNLVASITGQDGVIKALNSLAGALNRLANWIDGINKPGDTSRSGSAARSLVGRGATPFPLLNGASAIYHWMHPDRDLGPRHKDENGNMVPFAKASERAKAAYQRSLHSHALLEKANVQMMKAHTSQLQKDAMSIAYPGQYGRVTRDGAIPRALDTGFVLNRYLASKALQLSAF